jgi:hypothetical protein
LVVGDYSLTKEEIKEAQERDSLCEKYKTYEKFWLDEDQVLYYKGTEGCSLIVIPDALVETVLRCYHELPFTAHQGIARTIAAIRRKYWWESLTRDVREYINACEACAKRKKGNKIVAPLGESLGAKEFLDVVSLDVVGPLPVIDNGNKYLLTFVDHFTRFREAIPIPTQEAEVIARKFVMRIITQFGVPKKLLTDRGAAFMSVLMREVCKLLKIQKLHTTNYHAQANGICERMHKLLIDMISHFVNKDARNWDKYVPCAVMAYRATPYCTVKYSPYYLVYGRDLRLPIEDDWRPKRQEEAGNTGDYDRHVSELAMRLYEANKEAKKQSKLSHEIAKKYYDRKTPVILLKKGDFVYLYNPIAKRGRAKKFEYKYQGPYMILEKISPLIYKLEVEEGKSTVVHVNRLKRAYTGPEVKKNTPRTEKLRLNEKDQSLNQSDPQSNEMIEESREEGTEIPSIPIREVTENKDRDTDEESSKASPTPEDQQHPEWAPETRYLRRKRVHENNRSLGSTSDSPYALRSRSARTQFQEDRNESGNVTLRTPENSGNLSTDNSEESYRDASTPHTHPYNLRSRTRTS